MEPHETAGEPGPALPSFPRRVMDVFFSPGRLVEALAAHPAWASALLAGVLLVVLQVWLIPLEVWESTVRQLILEQGRDPQGEIGATALRVSGLVGGAAAWAVIALALAGLFTLVFAILLGDEGRYVQYLSVLAHAWLIPALVGLVLVPLRISRGDPQLTLSVGTFFFFFLQEGYLLKVLTFLDLSQLWAVLVVAQGAHAIDSRRSFTSAAVILLLLNLVLALVLAPFVPG